MELIYSMRRKPLKCEPPHFESPTDTEVVRPICTISSSNIIAFSSPTELSDVLGDTWGGHVYVCDLDTPWDSHKVTSTAHPVSALEWDSEGKQLLVGTTAGDVWVFGQKEYLLNDWTCLYTANFPGEHIIKASFFHNGRRVVLSDKKPDAPISEKFQAVRATPTLKGFGGIACEGAAIVTATGLVGALTPPAAADSNRAVVVTESLRPTRDYITCATIAHKNGNLVIACVCRLSRGWCVRVCVCSVSSAPPQLAVQPLPALYLPKDSTPPVSITWCLREDSDSLLIAGSSLALWQLSERAHPVHKLLSKPPPGAPPSGQKAQHFNTVVWQQTCLWAADGGCAHVAACRLALAPPLAVCAAPRALRLRLRDNHHYLCTRPVITSGTGAAEVPAGAGTPPKKPKYGPGVLPSGAACAIACCVDVSHLGGVCVCIDTHAQLHVYSLQLHTDIPSPMALTTHACTLLEYSLVTGYDCLDVLMGLKPAVAEAVYERFTETFQRQPPSFQQYYYHSWLKLRIALCRLSAPLSLSGAWLTATQMCNAAWAAAAAALRPDDKPDAAPLAHLLDEHHDQDKTLTALESKPESLGDVSAAGALRRPLQRGVDAARAALLALPAHQHPHAPVQHHGYEIWSDPAAILVLRQLVVLARACGRGGDALSRPLARLHAGPKLEQEDWVALSAMPSAPGAWDSPARCSVAAPHQRPLPLFLEYGVEPEALRYAPEPPYTHCETTPTLAMDSIRYMYLGGGWRPAKWRSCGRCGARALPAAQPARHPVQRAHDARFLMACRCGGKWSLVSNV